MNATQTAHKHYGDNLPEWIATLAEQVDQRNQRTVASDIGYSPAVISQILKGIYKGNSERVADAIRGAYCGLTVNCPVLGEIQRQTCLTHQRQGFTPTNPIRVRLFRACRGECPHANKN